LVEPDFGRTEFGRIQFKSKLDFGRTDFGRTWSKLDCVRTDFD
jgi:hypothetical protein